MRMTRALWKKLLSMGLSLTMTVGALTAMGAPITAEAAEDTGEAAERIVAYQPGSEKYAAIKDLKKNKYNLKGSNSLICSAYFGKGANGLQRWYIAGYDFKAGNLVLLCDPTEPLAKDADFLDKNRKQKEIETTDEDGNVTIITKSMILELQEGEGTYDNGQPENGEISVNHYGASLLRKTLQEMETDSSIFAKDEQALMLPTKIYTYDIRNKTQYYTNDKLYAPYGDASSVTNYNYAIIVGGNSSAKLGDGIPVFGSYSSGSNNIGSPYNYRTYNNNNISSGSLVDFWLRKTNQYNSYPSKTVSYWSVYDTYDRTADVTANNYEGQKAIVPAFAMDLSNVLFASAVPTETNTAGMEVFQDSNKNKLYPFTMTF